MGLTDMPNNKFICPLHLSPRCHRSGGTMVYWAHNQIPKPWIWIMLETKGQKHYLTSSVGVWFSTQYTRGLIDSLKSLFCKEKLQLHISLKRNYENSPPNHSPQCSPWITCQFHDFHSVQVFLQQPSGGVSWTCKLEDHWLSSVDSLPGSPWQESGVYWEINLTLSFLYFKET